MDEPKRALIVTAEQRGVSARLPLLLRRAGMRVDVLGKLDPDLWVSRYVNRRVSCPASAIVPTLRAHLSAGRPYDWVILSDERVLGELLPLADQAWVRDILPVVADARGLILSKAHFTAACQRAGVRLPRSVVCASVDEAVAAGEVVGWPLIIKRDVGFAGLGVRRVDDADALRAILDKWRPGPWIVQRFVRGRVGSTQLLLDHGRPVCWFASTKRESYPSPFSPSCVRQVCEHPRMAETAAAVGKLSRFHGLCAIDWMVEDDGEAGGPGELYLLELNPRPAPVFHLAHHVGVDFSAAIRSWLAGDRNHVQSPRPMNGRPGAVIHLWPQYAKRCVYTGRRADLRRLLPLFGGSDVPWEEPRIVARQAMELVGHVARRVLKRARKVGGV